MDEKILVALISIFGSVNILGFKLYSNKKTRSNNLTKDMRIELDNMIYKMIEYQNKLITLSSIKYEYQKQLQVSMQENQKSHESIELMKEEISFAHERNKKLKEEIDNVNKKYNEVQEKYKDLLVKYYSLKNESEKLN